MGDKSAIEWTEATWNPTTGCTKVSPGCAHCYIDRTPPYRTKGLRFERGSIPIQLFPDRLDLLLRWRKPRRIFVNSLSDLFHKDVPDEFIDRVFAVMALARQHTFQVLTKRPERMREYLTTGVLGSRWVTVEGQAQNILASKGWPEQDIVNYSVKLPLPNVWLGVSVENQRWADERIPILLDTPAAVRFISAEPLLGAIELKPTWLGWARAGFDHGRGKTLLAHKSQLKGFDIEPSQLDWVIVGGESGPKHRPFDPAWARSIIAQCRDAGVACFVKQLGGLRPGNKIEELPEDLRVRQFPA